MQESFVCDYSPPKKQKNVKRLESTMDFLHDLWLLHGTAAKEAADEQESAHENEHDSGAEGYGHQRALLAFRAHSAYFTILWVTSPSCVISRRPMRSSTSTTF